MAPSSCCTIILAWGSYFGSIILIIEILLAFQGHLTSSVSSVLTPLTMISKQRHLLLREKLFQYVDGA